MNGGREAEDRGRADVKKTTEADAEGGRHGRKRRAGEQWAEC